MPVAPDVTGWRSLLSACKLHGNVAVAEIATRKLLELDPCDSGNYVLLSNTYAGADRWDDAMKMRELMEDADVQKSSWSSSIEVDAMVSNYPKDPGLLRVGTRDDLAIYKSEDIPKAMHGQS